MDFLVWGTAIERGCSESLLDSRTRIRGREQVETFPCGCIHSLQHISGDRNSSEQGGERKRGLVDPAVPGREASLRAYQQDERDEEAVSSGTATRAG